MLKRYATADAVRQRLSPAGFFRGERKDVLGTRRFVEESQSIGDRVLLCRGCKLVHEAFRHEDVVRWADTAPKGRRNAGRFHTDIFDVQIRKGIDQIDRALGGVAVETIFEG